MRPKQFIQPVKIFRARLSQFPERLNYNFKTRKKILFSFVLIIFLLGYPHVLLAQAPRYNVLFIAADDMNDRVNFMGWSEVVSPNLQRLLNRGMLFTRAYAQYPLCNPSRTAFLSGWRPDRTGVIDNQTRPRTVLSSDVKFLPEYFKQYGYQIERYGKILHNPFENDITWDYAEPPELQVSNIVNNVAAGKDPPGVYWVTTTPDSLMHDGKISRHLVNRLQQPQAKPFFYGLGLLGTHDFFIPNLTYWNLNGDPSVQELLPIDSLGNTRSNFRGNGSSNIILPATPPGDRNDVPRIAFTGQLVKSTYEWQKTIHAYDGEVAELDAQLGLVLDELDRQDLWSNTIVVFFGDHGQHLGEHEGLWQKQTLFEESLHVPLIICAPGKQAGVCSKLIELEDVYPTLLELCALPPVGGMEGSSFVRLLDNPTIAWKSAVFSQVSRQWAQSNVMGKSVATEQYRYNSWETYGEELYDHNSDPHEYTNLVTNPAYNTVLSSMRQKLSDGWRRALPPPCDSQIYYRDADVDGFGNASDSVVSCYMPAGYVSNKTDCDDNNFNIYSGAAEICDSIDNNCNGQIDEGLTFTFYRDADNDGYGNVLDSTQKCSAPPGYVTDNTDCNDGNIAIHPNATEICDGLDNNCDGQIDEGVINMFYRDADADGYGAADSSTQACSLPDGYVTDNTDCDDDNAAMHPGASEICDGLDNDCNGEVDEMEVLPTYYLDSDSDGYGDAANSIQVCPAPEGYVSNSEDCDDNNVSVHPGVQEITNGIDDNCDGEIDEKSTFYLDTDRDGYGDENHAIQAFSQPDGYVNNNGDCNDSDSLINPNAQEVCDGIDNNCDGQTDEGVLTTFYRDADNDGYGDDGNITEACSAPQGYVSNNDDCNDNNGNIHPGAAEVCDAIDNNCNGQTDEGVKITFYRDADNDNYGDGGNTIQSCSAPQGYVSNNDDCNDNNGNIHPGAAEVCDGIDNNCNGQTDEGVKITFYRDADNDGYGNPAVSVQACSKPSGYVNNNGDCNDNKATVHPGVNDVCDGIDNNCDAQIDENKITAAVSPSGTVSICNGNSVLLSANNGSNISHQWLRNGIIISGAITSTYTTTLAGNYKVSESNNFNCKSTSAITAVQLLALPNATITPLGNLDICQSGSVILQANGGIGFTYQWTKNGNNIANAKTRKYTAKTTGTYRVIVTNSNGCSNTSAGVTVTNSCGSFALNKTSITESSNTSKTISLYPNPSTGDVTVNYYSNSTGEMLLKVFDVTGKPVFTKSDIAVKGNNVYHLSLHNLVSGFYYLELNNHNELQRFNLIIAK